MFRASLNLRRVLTYSRKVRETESVSGLIRQDSTFRLSVRRLFEPWMGLQDSAAFRVRENMGLVKHEVTDCAPPPVPVWILICAGRGAGFQAPFIIEPHPAE